MKVSIQAILKDNSKFAVINLFFATIITLLLFSVSEKSLGWIIRLVILHVAFIQVSLVLLAVNSFVSLLAFKKKFFHLIHTVKILMASAVILWIASFILSAWVTKLSWGGIDWQEPRFVASTQLLFILLPYWGLNMLINYDWLTKFTSISLGIFAQFLIRSAPVEIHPVNPIGSSDSSYLKLMFVSIILLTALWIGIVIYKFILTNKNQTL